MKIAATGSWRMRVLFSLILLVSSACSAFAAEEAGDAKEPPKPTTISDPKIAVDQLQLMLKPLTVEELKVEADGWFDLVRAKARQISAAQLGVKKTNEAAEEDDPEKAKQAAEDAKKAEQNIKEEAPPGEKNADANDANANDANQKAEANGEAKETEEQKETLLENVNKLREEQTSLIDRLNTVLDSLEKKGGDVESYRKYLTAISGVDVDVTDAKATYSFLTGWLSSEEGGVRWLKNILLFIGILFISWIIARIVGRIVNNILSRWENVSLMLRQFTVSFVRKLILLFGFVIALAKLEVNIGPMLAAIGAMGFIVGFALQGTLANFASGLMILLYRPYDKGDVVTAGGVTGKVESMSIVSTTFLTPDNQKIIVPNSSIWGGVITNITANPLRRVDLTFGIGYEDDMAQAEELIMKVLDTHPLIHKEPAPVVKVHELADSSVNFVCRPWTNTSDYWTVYWDVTRKVKEEFDNAGISIPFPQQDIHIHQTSGAG